MKKHIPNIITISRVALLPLLMFLLWDGKRYWCELCQMSGESGQRYREQLVIGAGCCCPMNTDRRDIPAPMQFSA